MASCGHEKAVQTGCIFYTPHPKATGICCFRPGMRLGVVGPFATGGWGPWRFQRVEVASGRFRGEDREGRWLVMWHGAGWLAGLNAETGELRWVRRVPSFTAAANMTVEISMTRCGAGRFRIGASRCMTRGRERSGGEAGAGGPPHRDLDGLGYLATFSRRRRRGRKRAGGLAVAAPKGPRGRDSHGDRRPRLVSGRRQDL